MGNLIDDIKTADIGFDESKIDQEWIEIIQDPSSSLESWKSSVFKLLDHWLEHITGGESLEDCILLDFTPNTSFSAFFGNRLKIRFASTASQLCDIFSREFCPRFPTVRFAFETPIAALKRLARCEYEKSTIDLFFKKAKQISDLAAFMRHAQLADKYHSVRQLESFVNANTRSDLPLSYDLRRIVEEAQRVLELDETVLAQEHRSLLLKLLTKTAKHHGYLPLQLYIKDVTRSGNYPVNGGGFADIWRGELNGSPVALKVLRVFGEPDDPSWKNVHRELCKEAILWRNLKHKNILPFLGLCANEFAPRIAMVSLWMKNGDLRSYLGINPTEDRIQILKGVICGLDYLHGQTPPIVHGDLRGANILFDDEGNPLISDFGLARVAEVHASASGTSSGHAKGSVRWMAPELLLPSLVEGHDGRHTLKSDMYAFAMVCIEVFTGAPPFEGLSDAEVVSTVINQDGRPIRAMGDAFQRGLRMHMWDIIRRCWTKDPSIRPRSKDISVILGAIGPSGAGTRPVSWFMEQFFKIDGITFYNAAEKPRQDLLLSRQRNRTTDGLEKRSDTLSSVPESIAPPGLPRSSLPPEEQYSSGKPITKDTNGPLPANSEVLENFFRSLLSKKRSESVPIVREEAVEIHGTLP